MVSKTCSWVLVAPVLLHFALAADKYIQDSDRFPGWKGELPHMKHGQPGEPDTVELAFGEHGKVGTGQGPQTVWALTAAQSFPMLPMLPNANICHGYSKCRHVLHRVGQVDWGGC